MQWLLPAGAYAALICSHNLSALIFSPFALLYPLGLLAGSGPEAARQPQGTRIRMLATCYLALGCGLLLSAWVWGPALAETGFAQTATLTGDYFHYSRHFRTANLVQGGLFFDYSVTPGSASPFAMGLVQAVLALCGLITLFVRAGRGFRPSGRHGRREGFLLLGLLVSTWMITPLSKLLWDRLPLLPMVQFPWRFLSVQALFAAAVLAALVPRGHAGGAGSACQWGFCWCWRCCCRSIPTGWLSRLLM